MTRDEFFQHIRAASAAELAKQYLYSHSIEVLPDPDSYRAFRERVAALFGNAERIAIVGSGNWKFSLNPDKGFREFGQHSDIDVALISSPLFHQLWEEMRERHRSRYYRLDQEQRKRLRRSSENVYAGFISPGWIPEREAHKRFEYKANLNRLSDRSVRYLSVKMLFFKNEIEAVDYYARGFFLAKAKLQEK